MTVLASLGAKMVMAIALGLQFDPVAALAGAMTAAVLMGYPKAPSSRRPLAAAVLTLAWLAGDGVHVGRSLIASPPHGWVDWLSVAVWVVVGAGVGYLVPAVAGTLVGRRVVRGTGWLSAGAVALAAAGALSLVAPVLADGAARMAGSL